MTKESFPPEDLKQHERKHKLSIIHSGIFYLCVSDSAGAMLPGFLPGSPSCGQLGLCREGENSAVPGAAAALVPCSPVCQSVSGLSVRAAGVQLCQNPFWPSDLCRSGMPFEFCFVSCHRCVMFSHSALVVPGFWNKKYNHLFWTFLLCNNFFQKGRIFSKLFNFLPPAGLAAFQ